MLTIIELGMAWAVIVGMADIGTKGLVLLQIDR